MISEFKKITFPIIIKDGEDLDVVYRLKDFMIDPDLYLHEYDSKMELIDCNGELWSWNYDRINKSNIPGSFKKTMSVNEVKQIVTNYFNQSKVQNEIATLLSKSNTIREILEKVADKF